MKIRWIGFFLILLSAPAVAVDYTQCRPMEAILLNLYNERSKIERRLRRSYFNTPGKLGSSPEKVARRQGLKNRCNMLDTFMRQEIMSIHPEYSQGDRRIALAIYEHPLYKSYFECNQKAVLPDSVDADQYVNTHPEYKSVTARILSFESKIKAAGCRP